MITNPHTGTSIDEVASGVYRINTPMDVAPGGFSVNSYLVVDEEPLLFHTGYRKMFPLTQEAINKVIPVESLRWIGGSHFEGDEYGATNEFLTAAPRATVFGSSVGSLISLNDFANGATKGLDDGEELCIGKRTLKWMYTPHVPHGWDCGILFDGSTQTLLCGDLFTQPGSNTPPVTESEILSASESFRGFMDYYAHAANANAILTKLAALRPTTLACQHGSAYRGDGAALIRELARKLTEESTEAT